jgi:serine/threonine protein phosphatase PrpC
VETTFETTNFQSLGSTCTLLYFARENKEIFLYSANIGDTRGLLISKSGASRITYDHKPLDDFENQRVKSNGGAIFRGRIFGQFDLTRAFGDIPLKKWVISDPFIKKSIINDNDMFAVIASDGIWEVISDEECFEMSMKFDKAKDFCEHLVNSALSRWSKDNISCIVVKV